MNFIFPKNYNFKNKFLGFIDYPTIFLNIIWDSIIFLCFPFLLISFVGLNGENFIYVLRYLISFIFKQKLYLYSKNYFRYFSNYNKKL